jgi:ribosomal protein L17
MPFQPGNKLAPKKPREFSDMLRIAIKDAQAEGGTKLRSVADALVTKAMSGDVQAIREVADRLDGKVPQQLQHANETGDGPAQFLFQTVYEQDNDK